MFDPQHSGYVLKLEELIPWLLQHVSRASGLIETKNIEARKN
jgi:hypothetical protein